MNNIEALKRYCTLTESEPVKNAAYWKEQADKYMMDVFDQQKMIDMLMVEIATLNHHIDELGKRMEEL